MWKKFKTASGTLTLDNSKLNAEDITAVAEKLRSRFGRRLTSSGKFGLTPDSAALELKIDGNRVTVGYDIWSGVFIMSRDKAGNRIIEEIESFLG